MFSTASGRILKIIKDLPEIQELLIEMEDYQLPQRAYNFPSLFRRVEVGETVLLNTSAVKLGLGTGGRHFVLPSYDERSQTESVKSSGHIMKLRYTPWQYPVLSVEEEASPYHQTLIRADNLEGTPVVSASLHSMLPGIILGFRENYKKNPKIAYIMTDGAALPLYLSDLVRELKAKKLLDLTITAGNAFGGDLEAISIPSALIAARQTIQADLIIVALGPGIAGTGTKLGFSGIEQSWVIDLTHKLGGISVTVPRVSGADLRERHFGISHHTLTILELANHPSMLALSNLLPQELKQHVWENLKKYNLLQNNHWYHTDEPSAAELFQKYDLKTKSMGRNVAEDPGYFQSTVAAGFLAAHVATGNLSLLEKVGE